MATYGYVRASTKTQKETLVVQAEQIKAQALILGSTVDAIFVDEGVSGSIPLAQRPEGAKLLAQVGRGDMIISPKLDRCFRSSLDALKVLEGLQDAGVSLYLMDLGGDVTGNGMARLVFTILSAVATAERDRIRERITDVKRSQRERGQYIGGKVQFGYRVVDGMMVEDEGEQGAIEMIQAMNDEGHSYRSISQSLKARGFNVSHMTVGKILKR